MSRTHPTLPGRIRYTQASRADYLAIARHHYRAAAPATFCRVRAAWHLDTATGRRRLVGVAVLSWPVPLVKARLRHFGVPAGYRAALGFANTNIRTITRVIVHPQFRALGVGRALVRQLVSRCPTRYVEASAVMGEFVGCFTAAGMVRIPTPPGEPAYFILDRNSSSTRRPR